MVIFPPLSVLLLLASIITSFLVIGTLGNLMTYTDNPEDYYLFSGPSNPVFLFYTACLASVYFIGLAGLNLIGDSFSVIKITKFFVISLAAFCIIFVSTSVVIFAGDKVKGKPENLRLAGAVFGLITGFLNALVILSVKIRIA